jgi:prepilin-type N-terminal cleavage/methylation domain-containing protein
MLKSHRHEFRRPATRGFTLIEITMALGIMLVVGSISIANIATVLSNARLHAGVASISGLFRNSRMLAVTRNQTLTTHFTTEDGVSLVGYVQEAQDTGPRSTRDPQVRWEAPVRMMLIPEGTGAPGTLSPVVLGFTPAAGEPTFNTRGLPCAYSSGNCPNSGFLYYFKDASRTGGNGWAALSISPVGRIKKWFWSGTTWTN